MILDVLANLHRYRSLHEGFAGAFDFLLRPELGKLPVGRYDIDGDLVYALVSHGPGRRQEDAQLEIHERYIDIQLVLAGADNPGWRPRSCCNLPAAEYDQQADVRFFRDEPKVWLSMGRGDFAIFFPEDAHLPSISSGLLHKIVVKVACFSEADVGASPAPGRS
ncbi:MAG: YhcH/YjgK/YiaL family protein [Deltaproteobacteria bacterium]|nr:YhcH/YjgK/YiaL family protein [Deltaproteobacteria bacterium]